MDWALSTHRERRTAHSARQVKKGMIALMVLLSLHPTPGPDTEYHGPSGQTCQASNRRPGPGLIQRKVYGPASGLISVQS